MSSHSRKRKKKWICDHPPKLGKYCRRCYPNGCKIEQSVRQSQEGEMVVVTCEPNPEWLKGKEEPKGAGDGSSAGRVGENRDAKTKGGKG